MPLGVHLVIESQAILLYFSEVFQFQNINLLQTDKIRRILECLRSTSYFLVVFLFSADILNPCEQQCRQSDHQFTLTREKIPCWDHRLEIITFTCMLWRFIELLLRLFSIAGKLTSKSVNKELTKQSQQRISSEKTSIV